MIVTQSTQLFPTFHSVPSLLGTQLSILGFSTCLLCTAFYPPPPQAPRPLEPPFFTIAMRACLSALDSVVILSVLIHPGLHTLDFAHVHPCIVNLSRILYSGTAAIAKLDGIPISTRVLSQHSQFDCCETHPGFYFNGPRQTRSALLTLSHVNRPDQSRLLQSLRTWGSQMPAPDYFFPLWNQIQEISPCVVL